RDHVPDETARITQAIEVAAGSARLVITTGGTGFGVRDVTPEATAEVLERDAPASVHAMIARGLEATPVTAQTRRRAGTVGGALVVNLPGSPKGATENLEAIIDLFPHVIQLLEGDNRHH